MWRGKSPGVKILWIWAFGTSGILVTSVLRTRMRDMEKILNSDDQQQTLTATTTDSIISNPSPESEQLFNEDKS